MKTHVIASTLLCVSCLAISAAPLTPEQALARIKGSERTRLMAKGNKNAHLALTVDISAQPACYVFNTDVGYIVASADDSGAPVLGYSDNGSIKTGNVPPALQYWLDSYAKQIAWARTHSAPAWRASTERPQRAPIEPMTETRWNQGAPYNNLCPEVDGQRCVTGCVATALAQIMYYHQWPEKGSSSHTYKYGVNTYSEDFADTEYDWADMLTTYANGATEAQKQAVATLMYSCGVAVNMQYGPDESSAETVTVPAAMVDYFNYDKGIRYYVRDYYTLEQWEDLVYEQLATYGPVQYSGQSNDGGHSFVCDGYSRDGYFHINWGWGGMSDGYFLLNALDPESQGIGGSTSGYNFDQDIIGNVQRPQEGSEVYEQLVFQSDFEIGVSGASVGSTVTVNGPVYNLSIAPVSGMLGLKFTDASGNVTYAPGTVYTQLPRLDGYREYEAQIPELTDGTYTVTPAYQNSKGEWIDALVPITNIQSETAVVSGGNVSFSDDNEPSIALTEVDTSVTPFYIGRDFEIQAVIVNTSKKEYYGTIVAALIDSKHHLVAYGDEYLVDVIAGTSSAMTYVSAFDHITSADGISAFVPGEYTLVFVTSDLMDAVSDEYKIDVKAAPTQTEITATDLDLDSFQRTVFDKDDLRFACTVSCTEGYFTGSLTLVLFPYTDADTEVESVAEFPSETLFIDEGKSMTVRFNGDFSQGEVGKKYMAMVYNGQTRLTETPLVFTLDSSSAVTSAAEDVAPATYYTIGGLPAGTNPTPGLYIRVTPTGVSKVMIK